ncbi:MAG: helix-turn-helix domain-containing protein, partial [Candidatus Hermodarchaeota archaeon]
LNPDSVNDIKSLSSLLKSKPLLIGIRNRYQKLEDNTIYIREDLPFITLNTLENILESKNYPYILARRGGGVIYIKGDLMRNLRESMVISRKRLSELLGVTKRTVCAYENETMRPSEAVANQISQILDCTDLFKQINLFEWNFKFDLEKEEIHQEEELNPFESHLQEIFNDIGIRSYWYRKGSIPFKLSLYSKIGDSEESSTVYPVFSGISDEEKKFNELNLKCLTLFRELFNKNTLFIVNNDIKIPDALKTNKTPILKIKSLEEVDDEEEFVGLIQESGK